MKRRAAMTTMGDEGMTMTTSPDPSVGDDPAQAKLIEKTLRAQPHESLLFPSRKNKLRRWQCEHCYDSNFPARGETARRETDPSTPPAVSAPPSVRVKVKLEPLGQSSVFAQFPSETETETKPAMPQPGPPIVEDRVTSPKVNVAGEQSSAPTPVTAGTRTEGRTLFELQYSPDISLALMCGFASLLIFLLRWWYRRTRHDSSHSQDIAIATKDTTEHKTDPLIVGESEIARRERDESEGCKIDTKNSDNQRSENDQLLDTPKPNKSGEEPSNSATTSPELVLEDIYAEAQRSSPSPVHNPFIIHSISPESDSEPPMPDDTDDASAISGLTESSSNQPPMNSGLFGSPCAPSKETTEVEAEERESLGTQLQRRFDIKVKHKLLSPFRKAKVQGTENDEMPVKPLPMSGKKKNVFADDNADDTTTDSSLNAFPVPETKKSNNPEERPYFVFGTNPAAFPRSVPVSPFASPQKDRRAPPQKFMYSPSALLRSTKTQT